jgi:hypothetical protein
MTTNITIEIKNNVKSVPNWRGKATVRLDHSALRYELEGAGDSAGELLTEMAAEIVKKILQPSVLRRG